MAHVRRKLRIKTEDDHIINWFFGAVIDDEWLHDALEFNNHGYGYTNNTTERWRELKQEILARMANDETLKLRSKGYFLETMPNDYRRLAKVTRKQIAARKQRQTNKLVKMAEEISDRHNV